jgi:hypothetical protein
MKKKLLVGICLIALNSTAQTIVKDTLFYTGSLQTWTVPCGASNVFIDAFGAKGSAGSTINPDINSGGSAGLGSKVSGALGFLETGDVLYVFVGGKAVGVQGGYNGGASGLPGNLSGINGGNPSGGGGGATDIRFPTDILQDRVIVAGGGGGGGSAGFQAYGFAFTGGFGGNGGGQQGSLNGSNGSSTQETGTSIVSPGAMGGTETQAGAAGDGCPSFLGQNGQQGSFAQGGSGGFGNAGFGQAQSTMAPNGGGGGGGYMGGNGGGGGSAGDANCSGDVFGAGGGGSAGTNYFDGPVVGQIGVNDGDGYVVITYTLMIDSIEIDESFTVPCVGESTFIFANNGGGGQFNVISGPSATFNDGEFTPSAEGTYVITCTDTDACGYATTDTVTVVIECTLGISEEINLSFSIYPNPATDILSIQNAENSYLEIIDLTGKTVLNITNYNGSDISINQLMNGTYLVKHTKNGVIGTKLFLKN